MCLEIWLKYQEVWWAGSRDTSKKSVWGWNARATKTSLRSYDFTSSAWETTEKL